MRLSLSVSRVYLVTFKSVSSYVAGIKCASALADFVTLSHSATVTNIRILLKATSYFSLSLHYVWIFTSCIFLNEKKKKKMSGLLSLSLSELEITITTIPIDLFVVILSQLNIIKELVIKILEMILRFFTYVIPSF